MRTEYNGWISHAVIIGRVTSNNAYYYAHTASRNAVKTDMDS